MIENREDVSARIVIARATRFRENTNRLGPMVEIWLHVARIYVVRVRSPRAHMIEKRNR